MRMKCVTHTTNYINKLQNAITIICGSPSATVSSQHAYFCYQKRIQCIHEWLSHTHTHVYCRTVTMRETIMRSTTFIWDKQPLLPWTSHICTYCLHTRCTAPHASTPWQFKTNISDITFVTAEVSYGWLHRQIVFVAQVYNIRATEYNSRISALHVTPLGNALNNAIWCVTVTNYSCC